MYLSTVRKQKKGLADTHLLHVAFSLNLNPRLCISSGFSSLISPDL